MCQGGEYEEWIGNFAFQANRISVVTDLIKYDHQPVLAKNRDLIKAGIVLDDGAVTYFVREDVCSIVAQVNGG